MVTHSLGGLLARALIQVQRPARLWRVVMLAPPNAGSEVADLVYRARLDRIILGPAGAHLRTARHADDERLLGPIDFELGIIAGNRALDPIFPRLIFKRERMTGRSRSPPRVWREWRTTSCCPCRTR